MKKKNLLALLLLATLFAACKEEFLAPDISGIETNEYVLNIGDVMVLAPNVKNLKGNNYEWMLNGKKISGATFDYTFTAREPGTFLVLFKAGNKGGKAEQAFKITVEKPIEITFEGLLSTPKSKVLDIKPVITGPDRDDYTYEWTIEDNIIGKNETLEFITLAPGNYTVQLTVSAGKQKQTANCNIEVTDAKYSNRPVSLLEYIPAPGNDWTQLRDSYPNPPAFNYPYQEFLEKASEYINENGVYFNLQNWGSSVTLGFDHTLVNIPSQNDFEVWVRSLLGNPLPVSFYVSYDKNKNGKADDEWFEIKTVDYGKEDIKEYVRTYTLVEASAKDSEEGKTTVTYKDKWEDNQGNKGGNEWTFDFDNTAENALFPGYYLKNGKIEQYDGWKNTFTVKGKLINKKVTQSAWYSQYKLNINDAVTALGEPAKLVGIDFIKIQNTSETYWKDEETPRPNQERLELLRDLHL